MQMNSRALKGSAESTAIRLFREHGGTLRTSECIRLGIQPRMLYRMRDSGVLVQLSRGVFMLADFPDIGNPDWAIIEARIPRGVVCLVSALSIHEITTQIPHQIDIALPLGAEEPRIDYPPIKYYHFSGAAFAEGVGVHTINGHHLRVYEPDKTVADCFKYRNKIGLDVVLEALKAGLHSRKCSWDKLMHFGRICRVDKVMRPYLEAMQ